MQENPFNQSVIEQQLLNNYQKQTLSFQHCFDHYSKLLKEWNELRIRNAKLESDIEHLEMQRADPKVYDNLRQEKALLELNNQKLIQEIDSLNKSVSIMTINFNEAEERYNEKRIKNDELIKQLLDADRAIKELTDKSLKNAQKADYYREQMEDALSDKKKLIDEISVLKRENSIYLEQLKKSKQDLIEKMNEINAFEEDVKAKDRQLMKEKELFDQRVKEFDTQKNQIEKRIDTMKKTSAKEIKKELESMDFGYNAYKMVDESSQKRQEYPKFISKKLNKYHSQEIYSICSNLNGTLMASCAGDRTLKFYDPFNHESKGCLQQENKIYTSLNFSAFNDYLLAGTSEKTVELYNYTTNKTRYVLTGHSSKVNAVSFTNDRDKCISSSDDRTLKLWDLEKGFCSSTINCLSSCLTMDYFNFEPTIVTGHKDGSMRLYSLKDGKTIFNEKNFFDSPLSCVKLSSNNNYIVVSSQEGNCLKCYDNRMKKVMVTLLDETYMNTNESNKICFGPDDKYVFGGNVSGSIVVWNLDSGCKKDLLKTDSPGLVIVCDYSPITGMLYTGDSRGNLTIWH